jgi:hypothetical protein
MHRPGIIKTPPAKAACCTRWSKFYMNTPPILSCFVAVFTEEQRNSRRLFLGWSQHELYLGKFVQIYIFAFSLEANLEFVSVAMEYLLRKGISVASLFIMIVWNFDWYLKTQECSITHRTSQSIRLSIHLTVQILDSTPYHRLEPDTALIYSTVLCFNE